MLPGWALRLLGPDLAVDVEQFNRFVERTRARIETDRVHGAGEFWSHVRRLPSHHDL